jgi:hypothetical protein
MARSIRTLISALLLVAAVAHAHPEGFHKRIALTVTRDGLDGLLTMDVDGGERCELMRAGADTNRDGLLQPAEVAALKAKLLKLAMVALQLEVSGYKLTVQTVESKISLKEEPRVAKAGLSLAVMLKVDFPQKATPGLELRLRDTAPDEAPVQVHIYPQLAGDGGSSADVSRELNKGEVLAVRLPPLAGR